MTRALSLLMRAGGGALCGAIVGLLAVMLGWIVARLAMLAVLRPLAGVPLVFGVVGAAIALVVALTPKVKDEGQR